MVLVFGGQVQFEKAPLHDTETHLDRDAVQDSQETPRTLLIRG